MTLNEVCVLYLAGGYEVYLAVRRCNVDLRSHVALGCSTVCKAVLNVHYHACGNVVCRNGCLYPVAVCCNVRVYHSVLCDLLRNLSLAIALCYCSSDSCDICVEYCAIECLSVYNVTFATFTNTFICVCGCSIRVNLLSGNNFMLYITLLNIYRSSCVCGRCEGIVLLNTTCTVDLAPLACLIEAEICAYVQVVIITHGVNVRKSVRVILSRLCDEVCNVEVILMCDCKCNVGYNCAGCETFCCEVTLNVDSGYYPALMVLYKISVLNSTGGYEVYLAVRCCNVDLRSEISFGCSTVCKAVLNVHYHACWNVVSRNGCCNPVAVCCDVGVYHSVLSDLLRNLSLALALCYSSCYSCYICVEYVALECLSVYNVTFATFTNTFICVCGCSIRVNLLSGNNFMLYITLLNIYRSSCVCGRCEGIVLLYTACSINLTPLASNVGSKDGGAMQVVIVTHRGYVRKSVYVVLCRLCYEVCNVKVITVYDSNSVCLCISACCKAFSIECALSVNSCYYPAIVCEIRVVTLYKVSILCLTVGNEMFNSVSRCNGNS